jgi:bile acid-coenzyme A ligase
MALVPMGALPEFHAQRDPDRIALVHESRCFTRREFANLSNRYARALSQLGVREGDFVTIALPNCVEFYLSSFAIWKLGAIPNVISPNLPVAEREAILDQVKPSLVISEDDSGTVGYRWVSKVALSQTGCSDNNLESRVAHHWKAMTSGGSTGRPKVIIDQLPSCWDPAVGSSEMLPDRVVLNPGPLYHNAPFVFSHMALFLGCKVVVMTRFDAEEALRLIAEHKVDWVTLVPTMMHRIWRLPEATRRKYDLSSLRVVLHMAAPCPIWLKEWWIDWLGPERIFELYAGTERQGFTSITGQEWLEHKGSVGKVGAGFGLKVLDQDGNTLGPGEVGEIYFLPEAGPGATYRYIGAEPRRAGNWESLGDMGHLDEDGYLYLADRRTDLILSGGANIYPAEVESAIDAHPNVLSSAVIGLPDDDMGQMVHAIVQLKPGLRGDEAEDELRAFVAQRLTKYKLPRSFEFVDSPLRDDAGKIRRSQLREDRVSALAAGQRG